MIEEPKTLELARKIYEKADIDRSFTLTLNNLYFNVTNDALTISRFENVNIIVADHLFDSSFLESELTAYLVASDPELAKYYKQHHLSYLEGEMKYFLMIEVISASNDSANFYVITKGKNRENVLKIHKERYCLNDAFDTRFDKSRNKHTLIEISEIPKAHFDILAKYITVV